MPHPVEWCYGSRLHCWSHDEDEPDHPCYRACFECKHVFTSAEVLLAEHNAVLWEIAERTRGEPFTYGWSGPSEYVPETDPEQVFCCPHCVHDF